jgi:hypothetical protein
VRVAFFDVGETLVRETRMWADWAEHLGVSPDRLIAVLEDVVGRGLHHHEAQQADLTLRTLEDLPDVLAGLLPQS